jgi:uncharacterized tellurite resistance protein B-like protein
MLEDGKKCSLKLLVALAWADGRVDEEEMEVVEAMLDAYGADGDEAQEIRDWAREKRSLDDVDVSDMNMNDLTAVLQHAVLLTYIDGEQSETEIKLLKDFIAKLGLTMEEAEPVLMAAEHFTKQLLPELKS